MPAIRCLDNLLVQFAVRPALIQPIDSKFLIPASVARQGTVATRMPNLSGFERTRFNIEPCSPTRAPIKTTHIHAERPFGGEVQTFGCAWLSRYCEYWTFCVYINFLSQRFRPGLMPSPPARLLRRCRHVTIWGRLRLGVSRAGAPLPRGDRGRVTDRRRAGAPRRSRER